MTDQTEFTPEIKAEAERRLRVANLSATLCLTPCYEVAVKTVAQLLTETGWEPDVDPIEAKAREIVAGLSLEGGGSPRAVASILAGDYPYRAHDIRLAKAGILAGMEMGKS